MVALIPEARAARVEARRLRREVLELKLVLRESAVRSLAQRRAAAAALSGLAARRGEPLPSPWGTLRWSYDAEPLTGVLVAIP
ncbi:MAG TPA: hypothetical protein VE984_00050 [Gaiellaceae bacterium]|nr:hypothetical protein [Gaiellaceae bacterium]